MRNIFLLLSVVLATSLSAVGFKQESNFMSLVNVSPNEVISKYRDSTVVFFRNDSSFTATIDDNGELQNIVYAKELKKLEAEGQIAYNKSGKLYYSKSGKLFISEEKKNGKWSSGKPVELKGSNVTRDKYKGSVLAYANWRYMPKDSIMILNPAINEEGDVLYFVSNMADSKGLDIWFVEKNEDGEWGYPQRIGREVNTSADEDMPFVREDGKLVFASNRKNIKTSPDKDKYDIYIYDPVKGRRSILLANHIVNTMKEPELIAEKTVLEPISADTLIAIADSANLLVSIDKPLAENNSNSASMTDTQNSPVAENVSNTTNLDDVSLKKSENDRIIELLANNSDNMTEDITKVTINQLEEAFQMNSDSILKASQNVLATADKRIFYFDYDKDDLTGDYAVDINVLLEFINFYPNSSFLIIGNTDERGSFEYNDALSLKRAKKIQSILIKKGIPKDRLYVMGLGEYKPIIKNASTESEHQKNRRVEIQRMD